MIASRMDQSESSPRGTSQRQAQGTRLIELGRLIHYGMHTIGGILLSMDGRILQWIVTYILPLLTKS